MNRDNPILMQVISLVLAAGLHAVILFGHFSLRASTIGDEGVGSVELAPGPPGDNSGEVQEPPPPPPPPPPPDPGEALPEPPAEEEALAEEPKADDIPEPDAEVKEAKKDEPPRINVQYESPVYTTNKMSAEETQRAIEFLLKHGRPGTGQPGSKPGGGGGGGGGKRYGDVLCKKCPIPQYPYEARKSRKEGVVIVRVLIGTDGRVLNVAVQTRSGSQFLDDAAVRAVRRYEFEPKRLAGIPVTTTVEIPFDFQMEKGVESPDSTPASPDAPAQ